MLCNEVFHTLNDLRQVSQKALSKLGEELKKSFWKVSFPAVARFRLGVAHYYVQYCDCHNHVVVAKHFTDGESYPDLRELFDLRKRKRYKTSDVSVPQSSRSQCCL